MTLTVLLIGVCVVASLLGWFHPDLIRRYGLNNHAVFERGEWYRLLTHAFLHADIWHLLINGFVFYSFGTSLEAYLGGRLYGLLLVLGLVGSALASLLLRSSARFVVGIGLSGVVSAVVFALIVYHPRMRLLVFFVPMPAWVFAILYTLYSIYAGQRDEDGIDHWAHLGGAATGAAFAFLV